MARRRRTSLSAYVPCIVAQDLDDAADHHRISMSELIGRILSKAAMAGFPTDHSEFAAAFPPIPPDESFQ